MGWAGNGGNKMKNRAYYENLRDRMIKEKVAELLKDKDTRVGNYYPFEINNFHEFLENMPVVEFERIRSLAEACFQGSINSAQLAGSELSKGALRYWSRFATEQAEKEAFTVEELQFNERRK
jgi:hypothetical protein